MGGGRGGGAQTPSTGNTAQPTRQPPGPSARGALLESIWVPAGTGGGPGRWSRSAGDLALGVPRLTE